MRERGRARTKILRISDMFTTRCGLTRKGSESAPPARSASLQLGAIPPGVIPPAAPPVSSWRRATDIAQWSSSPHTTLFGYVPQQFSQQLQRVHQLFCLMVIPAGVTNVGDRSSGSLSVSRMGAIVDTPEAETSTGTVTDSPVGN